MLDDLFKNKNCFKLILGAGNEDVVEVERLVFLYSSVGCRFFDVSAKESVINAARMGLKRANHLSDSYICISVGSESDQHFCKAEIDNKNCALCYKCKEACIENAINKDENGVFVNEIKCIGCKRCIDVCPNNCISLKQKKADLKELLLKLVDLKLDCIEYHVGKKQDIKKDWEIINELFNGMLSISINRSMLSDIEVIEVVSDMLSKRKPYTTIIQADGVPMSGGKDTYNSTLQAISTADLFMSKKFPAYIIASGGTNSKTLELAKLLDVDIDGVAIGSFARKIVKEYVIYDDFYENKDILNKAFYIAGSLVQKIMQS